MHRLACVLLLVAGWLAPAAAQAPTLVAVDEGSRLRGIARYDGARWTASCEIPARPQAAGQRRPRLLVTPGVPVAAVRDVVRESAEWRQLEPLVTRLFDDRGRREGVSRAALAGVPLHIDAIAATPQSDPVQFYFFRASKTVPDSRGDVDLDEDGEVDPKGELRVDVSGWLRRGGELSSLGTNATLSWEQVDDRPEGGTRRSELNPIGLLRGRDANVWVMQGRAVDSTWYALYDVDAGGIRPLVRTDARAC